jgi:hypothetical protein
MVHVIMVNFRRRKVDMKRVNAEVDSCFACPYCDGFWHDDASGWCCKSEREIDDLHIIAEWCELDDC